MPKERLELLFFHDLSTLASQFATDARRPTGPLPPASSQQPVTTGPHPSSRHGGDLSGDLEA